MTAKSSIWKSVRRRADEPCFWCVVAVILMIGLFIGWQVRASWHEQEVRELRSAKLLEAIMNAHKTFSVREDARPEFGPDRLDDMNSFSEGRVGFTLKFPDERPKDFRYMGGRIFPIGSASALLLTFKNGKGPVSVAAFRDPFELAPDFGQGHENDAPVAVKRESGYTVTIVGQTPDSGKDYLIGILQRVPEKK